MPWFPVPFILIEPPNKKTDEYEYKQVSWTNNTYSPAIKRLLITQDSSYWYYDGYGFEFQGGTSDWITEVTPYSDLSQTHPPKKTITDISATVIRVSMIPSDYPKTHYNMKYVLKFKANPNSKNKVVRFCSSRQEKIVKDVTRREIMDGFQWMLFAGNETTAAFTSMYVQQGENAVITNETIKGIDFEKLIYYEPGANVSTDKRYHGLATQTFYNICTVDLSKPGSYAYLVFQIGHARTSEERIKPFFDNGQQADCSCFLSMELDKIDDIIFGEGFSLMFLGETLVDAGMIDNGEIAPSAIYVGENMVWSN